MCCQGIIADELDLLKWLKQKVDIEVRAYRLFHLGSGHERKSRLDLNHLVQVLQELYFEGHSALYYASNEIPDTIFCAYNYHHDLWLYTYWLIVPWRAISVWFATHSAELRKKCFINYFATIFSAWILLSQVMSRCSHPAANKFGTNETCSVSRKSMQYVMNLYIPLQDSQ